MEEGHIVAKRAGRPSLAPKVATLVKRQAAKGTTAHPVVREERAVVGAADRVGPVESDGAMVGKEVLVMPPAPGAHRLWVLWVPLSSRCRLLACWMPLVNPCPSVALMTWRPLTHSA